MNIHLRNESFFIRSPLHFFLFVRSFLIYVNKNTSHCQTVLLYQFVVLTIFSADPHENTHYLMTLNEWSPNNPQTEFYRGLWNVDGFSNYNRSKCRPRYRTSDGSKVGEWEFGSILINGHGWHDQKDLAERPLKLPLTSYQVKCYHNMSLLFKC